MSTTVEGRPVSSPPSIARSAPATIDVRNVVEAGRRRLAAEVGRGLEDRAHRPRQGPGEQADAEPLGVLAAGERVAVPRVGDDQRHRARQQGADRGGGARAEPGDQLPHRQRREVHDRRGLALVATLEAVDPRDRAGVERVAGEAVEAVGGEDGDAAGGDAALQGRAGDVGGAGLDRDDLGGSARAHRSPSTTRSIPARSRRVSIAREPGLPQQLRHRRRLPLPHLERQRGRAWRMRRTARRRASSAGSRRGRRGRRAAPRAAPTAVTSGCSEGQSRSAT